MGTATTKNSRRVPLLVGFLPCGTGHRWSVSSHHATLEIFCPLGERVHKEAVNPESLKNILGGIAVVKR